jgi:hypothetical protein
MKLPLSIFLLCFSVVLSGQCVLRNVKISNGQVSNHISDWGYLDHTNGRNYLIDDGDTIVDISNSKAIWIGGYDLDSIQRLAASQIYNQNNRDFYQGPINGFTQEVYYDNYCFLEKTIWTFSGSKIKYLKERFQNLLLLESDIPSDFWSYPAKGNSWYENEFGFELMEEIAPFWDRNNDGKYNPMDGDLPIPLKENNNFYPYQFSYTVINDLADAHQVTQVHKGHFQIQIINFVLDPDLSETLGNSIFSRVIYENKGPHTFRNAKISIAGDRSTSCSNSYFGSSPSNNSYFNYDKQVIDNENCNYIGSVQVTSLLNKELNSFSVLKSYSLDSILETTEPSMGSQYINIMNGLWKDGTPMTKGGDGYDENSNAYTNFMFDGCPSDSTKWHMHGDSITFNIYYGVASIDIGGFNPGDKGVLDMVDINIYSDTLASIELACNIEGLTEEVKDYYEQIKSGVITSADHIKDHVGLRVYPNPTSDYLDIELVKLQEIEVELYDTYGRHLFTYDDTNINRIDLSKFENGIYFLIVKTEDFRSLRKIVKN